MKNIVIESYQNGLKINSATNTETNFRISRIPAKILNELSKSIGNPIDKGLLVTRVYGKDNYFIRRTFDVNLNKVKKLLIGTYYKIEYKDQTLCIHKLKNKNGSRSK